jgi:hypothetical protein
MAGNGGSQILILRDRRAAVREELAQAADSHLSGAATKRALCAGMQK